MADATAGNLAERKVATKEQRRVEQKAAKRGQK